MFSHTTEYHCFFKNQFWKKWEKKNWTNYHHHQHHHHHHHHQTKITSSKNHFMFYNFLYQIRINCRLYWIQITSRNRRSWFNNFLSFNPYLSNALWADHPALYQMKKAFRLQARKQSSYMFQNALLKELIHNIIHYTWRFSYHWNKTFALFVL